MPESEVRKLDDNALVEVLKNQLETLEATQKECGNTVQEILELSKQIESVVKTIYQIEEKVVTK